MLAIADKSGRPGAAKDVKLMKKRRTWKKYDTTTYSIEIVDWDVSYSLRLTGDMKDMPWPFWEHTSLDIKGKFLAPKELLSRDIEATLLGSRNIVYVLEHPQEPVQEPKAIGGLTVRGKQSEFIGSLPQDAFQMLCFLLSDGKIKVLELTGKALYRGSADIRSIVFEKEYKPEDS